MALTTSKVAKLSAKEREIINLVFNGLTHKEAYEKTGGKGKQGGAIVWALLHKPASIEYMDGLKEKEQDQVVASKMEIIKLLTERLRKEPNNAVLCKLVGEISKLNGLYTPEKVETKVEIEWVNDF